MSQVINELTQLKKKLDYNEKLSVIEHQKYLSLYIQSLQFENDKIKEKKLDDERDSMRSINYYQTEINQIENQKDDLLLNLTKLGVATPERKTSGGEELLDTIIKDGVVNQELAEKKLKQETAYRDQLISTIETLNFQTTELNKIAEEFAGKNYLLQPKEYERAIDTLTKQFPKEFSNTQGLDKIYVEKMKPSGSELKQATLALIDDESSNVRTGGANNIYSAIQAALTVPDEGTIDDVKNNFQYYDNNGNLVQPSDEQVLKLQKLSTSTTAPVFLSNLRAIDSSGELQNILQNSEISGMNYNNMVTHVDNIIQLTNELEGKYPEDKNEVIEAFTKKVKDLTDPSDIFDLYHKHAASATSDVQTALWSIDEIQDIDNLNEAWGDWLGGKGGIQNKVGSEYISGPDMKKNREEIINIVAGYPEANVFIKYNTPEKIDNVLQYLSHNIFKSEKMDIEGNVIGEWSPDDTGFQDVGGSHFNNMIYGNLLEDALGNPMFDDIKWKI